MILSRKNQTRISAFLIGILAISSMMFVYNNLVQTEAGGVFKSALIFLSGYFIFGIFFGAIWQDKNWRWTIWLIFPILILTGISVIFLGIYLNNFLMNDLPIIFISFFAAIVGNFIGADIFSGKG